MTLVLCFLLALAAWALAVQVLAQLAAFWLVRQRHRQLSQHWGVSILKPLKGVDPALESNLRSVFEQEWPRLEIVLGAADPADPGLELARRVARDYPDVATRVVTAPKPLGLNPKVTLCAALAEEASYDLVIISDASVVAPKRYVASMAECFSLPNTGLVSSPLVGVGESTRGGIVDNLLLNLFILRAVCFTKLFARHDCVIGKSMMFRLSDLRRLGGFHEVRDVLAEDYVLGGLFRRAGFDVRLCPQRLTTYSHCIQVRDALERHVRWCQMRRRTSNIAYLAELGANVTLWSTLLILVALFSTPPTWGFVACGLLFLGTKWIMDLVALLWLVPRRPVLPLLCWLPLLDILNFWVWSLGCVKRSVKWRGTRLSIGPDTRLSLPDRQDRTRRTPAYSTVVRGSSGW